MCFDGHYESTTLLLISKGETDDAFKSQLFRAFKMPARLGNSLITGYKNIYSFIVFMHLYI
jgi:hypothetical protein